MLHMPATHGVQPTVLQDAVHACCRKVSTAAINHQSRQRSATTLWLWHRPEQIYGTGQDAMTGTVFDSLGELGLDIEEGVEL